MKNFIKLVSVLCFNLLCTADGANHEQPKSPTNFFTPIDVPIEPPNIKKIHKAMKRLHHKPQAMLLAPKKLVFTQPAEPVKRKILLLR